MAKKKRKKKKGRDAEVAAPMTTMRPTLRMTEDELDGLQLPHGSDVTVAVKGRVMSVSTDRYSKTPKVNYEIEIKHMTVGKMASTKVSKKAAATIRKKMRDTKPLGEDL